MKYALIILLFIYINGCNTEKQQNNFGKINKGTTIQFQGAKDINYMSWNTQSIKIKNNTYILRLNKPTNEIIVYDLKDGSLKQRIAVPKQGKYAVGAVADYYYHNADSIFYTTYYKPHIFLYDSAGKYKNIYYCKNKKHPFIEQFFRNNGSSLFFDEGSLHIGLVGMVFYEKNPEIKANRPLLARYNIKQDSLFVPNIFIPDAYKETLVPDPDFSFTYNKNIDAIVVGFSFHEDIYLVRNDAIISSEKLPHSPNFDTDWFHKNWNKPNARVRSLFENDYLGNLIYDSYNDVYYQLIFRKGNFAKYNNLKITNRFFYKELDLCVISPDFKQYAKISLPAKTYNPFDYFIDENGFWLSMNNPEGDQYSEKHITFQLFGFKKNKAQLN